MDDFELLRTWRSGDESAANALTSRHYHSVLRFFEAKLPHLAEDLTQRCFLACVEGIERFRGQSSFRAYLFGIARNQLLMQLRKDGRAEAMARFDSFARPSIKTSMSTIVARREEQLLLLRALDELPTDMQLILQLYYWDGLPTADIADVFEIPPSTVWSRLARARELVREEVEKLPAAPASRDSLFADIEGWTRSLAAR